jgi:predicted DNA-binding protein (UPF0251 family)/predicted Fe-Mo cluster-binding NifX family protein
MPRTKNERKLSFKPKCTLFFPNENETNETITLLSEEIEALYLMDLLELYQEDAAQKMEISRPTFARIIKSARKKVALGLLMGNKLALESQKREVIVALCSNETNHFDNLNSKNRYICIFTFDVNGELKEKLFLDNPIYNTDLKPTIELTKIFLKYSVNQYIVSQIGEGFKSALVSKGIEVRLQKNFVI